MNSRRKGKRGELEFAALVREQGFDARRGQQFSGGAESPDVVSEALGWLHVEVKRVQKLNLVDACVQAEGDCGGKPWIVAHRRNSAPWLITLRAEFFFDLVRQDLAGRANAAAAGGPAQERKEDGGWRIEDGGTSNIQHPTSNVEGISAGGVVSLANKQTRNDWNSGIQHENQG